MYQQSLDLVRVTRARTLRLCAGMTQAQADYSPGVGKWSAGEVLDHLLLAEKLYRDIYARLIRMQEAGQRPVVHIGFDEVNTSIAFIPKTMLPMLEIPFTMLNLFVPTKVREAMVQFRFLPAQNPDVAVPQKGKSIEALRGALSASYDETAALLDANPALDYRRMRYTHPLMGDNTVLDSLRVVALHERRHQAQIEEILRSRQYPKVA
jgi:uncharacterized damage-inducible protein DinB